MFADFDFIQTPGLLQYKVGVNLLYMKIGEIRSVCYAAKDQSSKDELCLLLDSGLNTGSENGDDVTARDCARTAHRLSAVV